MYKKILTLILVASFSFILSGCHKNKTLILFNKQPIVKENILNNATEFDAGKRIYYIFLTEKPLTASMVRIKIYKREEKANFIITKLVYSHDFKVMKNEIYYYTDYIVLNDSGYYSMAIFAIDGLNKPLATGEFKVDK